MLTYLTRMERKGAGVHRQGVVPPHLPGRPWTGRPAGPGERQNFLDRVYHGSAGDLVAAFLKESPISAEERARLKALLDDMDV